MSAQIENALNAATRRLSRTREAAYRDGDCIVAAYRSGLPKEGAYDVGAAAYDDMVAREIARARRAISAGAATSDSAWMITACGGVQIEDEEKGWIYLIVSAPA